MIELLQLESYLKKKDNTNTSLPYNTDDITALIRTQNPVPGFPNWPNHTTNGYKLFDISALT